MHRPINAKGFYSDFLHNPTIKSDYLKQFWNNQHPQVAELFPK
jgi:hypothetical protein